MSQQSSDNPALHRAEILANHILQALPHQNNHPGAPKTIDLDIKQMRQLLDGHNLEDRDWLFRLMIQSKLFNPRVIGGKVFVSPDYNQSMEQQREMTMSRISFLLERGVFDGWVTKVGPEAELRRHALSEVWGLYDHSLAIMLRSHFFLWGRAIQFCGTKRHHEKWLKATEEYAIKACFAMTELGHGISNIRGIETVTTYDSNKGEFIINTPSESAQKYWIGGAALEINGTNQGIHAFIVQIRDADGKKSPNIRIADSRHKSGLNGLDTGRIWFDNVRVPRENLLNSVADVSPDGKYLSAIENPEQRFAAFLAPLMPGRINTAASAVYSAKLALAIAIRYSLTRRAFSTREKGPEILLIDCPIHQSRLFPLLAKTYAMSFATNHLKMMDVKRTTRTMEAIRVVSSAFKATFTWHNMRILQECCESCGVQGLKTENHVGHLKGEFDAQTTFDGDNNALMQQVSKALFDEFKLVQKTNKPFKGLGLEHMNNPVPVIPSQFTTSGLRCSQFQTDVFCLRERDLLNRLATEVAQHQAKGESEEAAFMWSHQLTEDLGRAYSEKAILQSFLETEATLPPGLTKDILSLLRSLYVLVCLEEDAAFLRYGYLFVENHAAVRKEVLKLCSELRPHALALVNSFGIPDAFLSPIAFNWVEANAWSLTPQKLIGSQYTGYFVFPII